MAVEDDGQEAPDRLATEPLRAPPAEQLEEENPTESLDQHGLAEPTHQEHPGTHCWRHPEDTLRLRRQDARLRTL